MTGLLGPASLIANGAGRFVGSGYMLAPHVLLTANYVVKPFGEDSAIRIQPWGSARWHGGEVIGQTSGGDDGVSLVRIIDPPPRASFEVPHCLFGRVSGEGPIKCRAVGFTQWDLDDTRAFIIDGTVDAETATRSSVLHLRSDRSIDQAAGIGGAGVCSGKALIGIIESFHPTRNEFTVMPIIKLLQDRTFAKLVERELGSLPAVEEISPVPVTLPSALREVSSADPANIQQVAAAQLALNNLYYENVLKQATRSFTAAVVAATAGLAMFSGIVVLSVTVKSITPAIVGSIGAALVEVIAGLNFWLYGKASAQLGQFHVRLERMQRYLVANSACSSLTDTQRDGALIELIRTIASASGEARLDPNSRASGGVRRGCGDKPRRDASPTDLDRKAANRE